MLPAIMYVNYRQFHLGPGYRILRVIGNDVGCFLWPRVLYHQDCVIARIGP